MTTNEPTGASTHHTGASSDPTVASISSGVVSKDDLRASLRPGLGLSAMKAGVDHEVRELNPVVGLFGTCGASKWRDPVMKELADHGIHYFNPVKANWTSEDAKIEAKHASTDKVVLMVITDETEAAGSLAETGWIENAAERSGQKAIFVIQDYHAPGQPVDPKHQANRARTLVRKHAEEAGVPVYSSIEPAVKEVLKEFPLST